MPLIGAYQKKRGSKMSDMNKDLKFKDNPNYLGPIAFIPILIFLVIYLGSGIMFSILGVDEPFGQVPRETALIVGLIAALFIGKDKLDDKVEIFSKSAGDTGVILMCLIFLLAGAFSGVAKEMGGVESTVNLGLTLVPRQFLFAGIFIISAVVATAMGTSMGTIAAIGPIAIGVAQAADVSFGVAIASVLGGAMFGDNLSIISDTTIAATRGVGAEMKDKFRMNGIIAGIAALITIIIYSQIGTPGSIEGNFEYSFIKIIPYIVVLVTAIIGLNVILVLLLGTVLAGIIGLLTGGCTIISLAQSVTTGMSGMYSIVIVSLLVRGLTGLATHYGAVDWLIHKMTKNIKSRRGAEIGIAGLVSVVDLALANNTIAIIVTAPLALDIAKKFNIARKRVASLLDIFSCIIQGIIPHGGQLLLCMTLANLSPLEIVPHTYYIGILFVVTSITIIFGFMKTPEEKQGINMYPEVDEIIDE